MSKGDDQVWYANTFSKEKEVKETPEQEVVRLEHELEVRKAALVASGMHSTTEGQAQLQQFIQLQSKLLEIQKKVPNGEQK